MNPTQKKISIAVLALAVCAAACGCRDLTSDELAGAGMVLLYDPATGITTSGATPPLIADLEHELMAAHRGRLYHFGTSGYASTPSALMVYDPVADRWELRPRPRVDLAHFASAPEGIYVLSNIAELFIYDPATNLARPLGRIPRTPEFGAFPVSIHYDNGMLHVVSSSVGPELLICRYDPQAATWAHVTAYPLDGYEFFFPEVVARPAQDGWYFLLFERSYPDIWNFTNGRLYRYDFVSEMIEERAPFPDKFEKCAFAADCGRDLYIFTEDEPEIEGAAAPIAAYRYDEAADAWTRGATFSVPGGCLHGAVSPDAAYLLGGCRAGHLMLVEYDFAGDTATVADENLGANFTGVFAHHDGFRTEWVAGKVVIVGMGFYRK